MIIAWFEQAWDDYINWQQRDKATWKRINKLIKDICRNPGEPGIGKPEHLKGEMSGWDSRRIDQAHRLVYRVEGETLHILSCRYHYTK